MVQGGEGPVHQSMEYYRLLGVDDPANGVERPELRIPVSARQWAVDRLPGETRWVAFLPGAARGPSKQWPEDCFMEAGRVLVSDLTCRVAVLGSGKEQALCERVTAGIGTGASCMAGHTSLQELAGALQRCALVVCNDSGGMHLAAAVGTRVVALYGMTDPAVTGPLGTGHRVLVPDGAKGRRDIPRTSAAAVAALRSIEPFRVVEAVRDLLTEKRGG